MVAVQFSFYRWLVKSLKPELRCDRPTDKRYNFVREGINVSEDSVEVQYNCKCMCSAVNGPVDLIVCVFKKPSRGMVSMQREEEIIEIHTQSAISAKTNFVTAFALFGVICAIL